MEGKAVISECGLYRYKLERIWDSKGKRLNFIMLNPSTADHTKDDPTIRKCIGFAKRLGFGSIVVTNLYAYRATKPKDLKTKAKEGFDIVGSENNNYICQEAIDSNLTVFACGNNVLDRKRLDEVYSLLLDFEYGLEIKCFPLTKKEYPPHPLMLSYSTELIPYPFIVSSEVEGGI